MNNSSIEALVREYGVKIIIAALTQALEAAIVVRDAGISPIDDRDRKRARGLAVRETREFISNLDNPTG